MLVCYTVCRLVSVQDGPFRLKFRRYLLKTTRHIVRIDAIGHCAVLMWDLNSSYIVIFVVFVRAHCATRDMIDSLLNYRRSVVILLFLCHRVYWNRNRVERFHGNDLVVPGNLLPFVIENKAELCYESYAEDDVVTTNCVVVDVGRHWDRSRFGKIWYSLISNLAVSVTCDLL